MIIDKIEFKQLLKEGGSAFSAIRSLGILEYGYPEIKIGTTLNVYVMNNGIFADITFGKKIYISFNSIRGVDVSNEKLIISVIENEEEKKIVFKIQKSNIIEKMYNTIRQNSNLEYKDIDDILIENKINETIQVAIQQEKPKKITERQRVKELKKERIPYCPKCHSTSLHYIEKRKRLSLGRTVVGGGLGAVLTGGIGAAAGAVLGGLSSNKMKKGQVKCLKCGHTWKL
ncbi:hypothetical protein [Clostridium beijerinckii]|uniref:DNA-directed RNA polymerase subunit M/transcription elongation factor TFIIS n=1 Tax=Clostridium beijerinckii TaxID=1520 RepID=A0AAE5H8J9_CLOBE|nr:hypothetical protein [Clostridium beijerinckii]NOW85296.1 DNA-directed RNA polymerase subunit M/transcription elongation factor TFIIS [Clostridium beijerinckii]NSB16442.1 DNA-directed RNA polymerase subunit M/transcription elongation factor TFIIS [Clostridium beijerinckii]OOM19219.1 hypothetical protein CLOBE_54320 [Clostridium beijerinckii]